MGIHKGMLGRTEGVASVKSFDRMPAVHMPANVPQSDVTLGDYIHRKYRQEAFNQVNAEKKLTFDEWWRQELNINLTSEKEARWIWEQAQENK